MKKTIVIGSSSPPDIGAGINAYVTQIVEVMLQLGCNVIYVAPPLKNPDFIMDEKCRHVVLGQETDALKAIKILNKLMQSENIDGVINNDHPFLQCISPLVDCCFISVGHMSRTSVATLACYNSRWIDYIVAISADMFHKYTNHYGLPVNQVPIVYNGVSDPHDSEYEPVVQSTHLNIIFAGGQGLNKGADILKTSLSGCGFNEDEITLHWFGHMNAKFKGKLSEYKFVKTYGRVERGVLFSVLKKCDIFLLPSISEGCPMSMLEAMSYGVVPVASDGIGSMQRLIIHGQEGYICRLDKWQQDMKNCINDLQSNKDKLLSMKIKTYKRFKSDFTSNITVMNLLDLLDEPVIERNKKLKKIALLKWHRPVLCGTDKAPFVDRLCIKLGYLRKHKKDYLAS